MAVRNTPSVIQEQMLEIQKLPISNAEKRVIAKMRVLQLQAFSCTIVLDFIDGIWRLRECKQPERLGS